MGDFRASFYERYVSEFKQPLLLQGAALESYWHWCDRRLRPLFEGLELDAPILEIGCGPGPFLSYLGRRGFTRASGIDISEEQVAIARKSGLEVRTADVFTALAAEEGTLGMVVALDVVEHFTIEENLRLFSAVHRALRPGGFFILQTPNGAGLFSGDIIYGDLTHLTIFTTTSLSQLLQRTRFSPPVFSESGPVAKNLAGCLRLVAWNAIRLIADVARIAEVGHAQAIWTQNVLCRARRD